MPFSAFCLSITCTELWSSGSADRIEAQPFQRRQAGNPLAARMHAGVQHHTAVFAEIEQIRVGTDLVGPRQVRQGHANDIPKSAIEGYKQITRLRYP
jgi:hypothetical protein